MFKAWRSPTQLPPSPGFSTNDIKITDETWWFFLGWASGIVSIIIGGAMPDGYADSHRMPGTPAPGYPFAGVTMFCLIVTLEWIWLVSLLTPLSAPKLGRRCLAGLVMVIVLVIFFGGGLMHAPPYQFTHVWWLMAAGITLMLITIVNTFTPIKVRFQLKLWQLLLLVALVSGVLGFFPDFRLAMTMLLLIEGTLLLTLCMMGLLSLYRYLRR